MPYARYIVSASMHRVLDNGESRQDGRPLVFNLLETRSFSLPREAKLQEIFDKVAKFDGTAVEIKVFEDLETYESPAFHEAQSA